MRSSKAAIPTPSIISACTPRGTSSVVRAFLPEASNVEAIGEHGETAALARIHDAGLFVGALPNGSKRYQLRARFGDTVVDLDDPYRFPPVLTDFDLYLLGEGTHQRIYDKLGAHPMTLDGVPGVAFVVLAPNAQAGQRGRRFQFLESAAASDAGARRRLLGAVRAPCHRGRSLQVRYHRSARRAVAAEIRPDGVCRGNPPEQRFDRIRRGKTAASAPGAIRHQRARRADVDLRGPSRLVAAQRQQRMAELSRARRAACRIMCRISASPMSSSCPSASIRSTARGAISRPACTRRPAGSARRRISPRWSMPFIARASACCWTGCPGISRTIRTASPISTAPRSTNTPTRCRAGTWTGAR